MTNRASLPGVLPGICHRKRDAAGRSRQGHSRTLEQGKEPTPGLPSTFPPYRGKMIRATVACAAVVAFLVGCGGSVHALRLPRDPYLGLRCHNPKVLRCGRVGLAVWLARPARNVTAVVDGHDVVLRTRTGGTGSYRRGLFWQG